MNIQKSVSQLEQFRQELYEAFDLRPDAIMELIDALSSTPMAAGGGSSLGRSTSPGRKRRVERIGAL
ncbi:MAG: hypothetical protein DRJ03_07190 [Chloroflexi bacterium]|nr:MAG: hypothetical protein DRJ03_07190 [Chloroflexota bacterium]